MVKYHINLEDVKYQIVHQSLDHKHTSAYTPARETVPSPGSPERQEVPALPCNSEDSLHQFQKAKFDCEIPSYN